MRSNIVGIVQQELTTKIIINSNLLSLYLVFIQKFCIFKFWFIDGGSWNSESIRHSPVHNGLFITCYPGARIEEFIYDKLEKKLPSKTTNAELLGQYMLEAASEFGPATPYGQWSCYSNWYCYSWWDSEHVVCSNPLLCTHQVLQYRAGDAILNSSLTAINNSSTVKQLIQYTDYKPLRIITSRAVT